jgi:hypothetical protein
MSLIELLMATGVFLSAGACSLQIWASSARATQQLGLEQRLLQQMDGQLVRLRSHWLRAAATPFTPMDCQTAVDWMLQDPLAVQAPAGLNQQLSRLGDGSGVAVALRSGAVNLERHRSFTPAALGLCKAQGVG